MKSKAHHLARYLSRRRQTATSKPVEGIKSKSDIREEEGYKAGLQLRNTIIDKMLIAALLVYLNYLVQERMEQFKSQKAWELEEFKIEASERQDLANLQRGFVNQQAIAKLQTDLQAQNEMARDDRTAHNQLFISRLSHENSRAIERLKTSLTFEETLGDRRIRAYDSLYFAITSLQDVVVTRQYDVRAGKVSLVDCAKGLSQIVDLLDRTAASNSLFLDNATLRVTGEVIKAVRSAIDNLSSNPPTDIQAALVSLENVYTPTKRLIPLLRDNIFEDFNPTNVRQ